MLLSVENDLRIDVSLLYIVVLAEIVGFFFLDASGLITFHRLLVGTNVITETV